MRSKGRFLILFIFLIFPADFVHSQNLKIGIITTSYDEETTKDWLPWDAVGQVNVSEYRKISQCTGTLVAQDLVLTAGHCLIDPKTKREFPAHTIHFLAGVHSGQHKGHSTAKCFRFLRNFLSNFQSQKTQKMPNAFDKDAAIIILSNPLKVKTATIADNLEVTTGERLIHIAYPAKRRFIPSAYLDCHLIQIDPRTKIWSTDCPSAPGSSGGPLFIISHDTLRLTAIMIGREKYSFALPFSVWRDLINDSRCP